MHKLLGGVMGRPETMSPFTNFLEALVPQNESSQKHNVPVIMHHIYVS